MHTLGHVSLRLCSLAFPGPRWYRKGSSTKLLFASRRSDDARRRKTAGNIADGLRCCIWRRAEKPEKMRHQLVWGGKNQKGYIALLHPNSLASRQQEYLAEHKLLSFLGKKICRFSSTNQLKRTVGVHALFQRLLSVHILLDI